MKVNHDDATASYIYEDYNIHLVDFLLYAITLCTLSNNVTLTYVNYT